MFCPACKCHHGEADWGFVAERYCYHCDQSGASAAHRARVQRKERIEREKELQEQLVGLRQRVDELENIVLLWKRDGCVTCGRAYTPETAKHWRGDTCNPCYAKKLRRKKKEND